MFKEQDIMFQLIYNLPEQMEEAFKIAQKMILQQDRRSVRNVIFSGMGGSASSGDLVALILNQDSKLPVFVNRDYQLPAWADENTLLILLSYSGETEETISSYRFGREKGCKILGISSGGTLEKELLKNGYDSIKIPSGYPPRAAIGILTIPVLYYLFRKGLINKNVIPSIISTARLLKARRKLYSSPKKSNRAYEVARRIFHTLPAIYGVQNTTEPIARRWRAQLEENGKIVAFHQALPEMNHNEIVGYTNNPDILKKMSCLWLADSSDNERIRLRREWTMNNLRSKVAYQAIFDSKSQLPLSRIFDLVYLGDWISYWVAKAGGSDPLPVKAIVRLKKFLDQSKK